MRNIVALLLMVSLAFSAHAATLDAAGAGEIEYLLSYLGSTNCQFNRNGTWYAADKASGHLRNKYEYFRDKGELDSAESFIAKAASSSSVTGKDYLVSCPGHEAEKSSSWLNRVLGDFRKERVVRR